MRKSTAPVVSSQNSRTSAKITTSSTAKSAPRSSILQSAFAPSHFQLHLFASVIQSFDSHQLRIHDTNSSRLRSQISTNPGTRITCLDWGYHVAANNDGIGSSSKRKRKRTRHEDENAVVAYGTSTSEILFFSPSEGKVVVELAGGHERGVRDFKFTPQNYSEAWSIGEDARLVQWSIPGGQPFRIIKLTDPSTNILATPSVLSPQILCASSAPSLIDLKSSDDFRIHSFDSFKNPLRVLLRGTQSQEHQTQFFLAADSERYINVYDMTNKQMVRTLIAASNVESAQISDSTLALLTVDGTVELFPKPFQQVEDTNGALSSRRKNLTRKSTAQIKLTMPGNKGMHIPITAVTIQDQDLVLATVQGGVNLSFQKVSWQDEETGDLLFDGLREVSWTGSVSSLQTANMNGVKDLGKSHVDESQTIVVNGGNDVRLDDANAIEILSSGDESEEDASSSDEEMADVETALDGANGNETSSGDESAAGEDDDQAELTDKALEVDQTHGASSSADESVEEVDQEPSFGQLLASRHPETIPIPDNTTQDLAALSKSDDLEVSLSSGISLGTVLTQSLRTNDQSLLESCLHTTNEDIIRNTIQRLDSSLAGILLVRLAERLSSRPGRIGPLITWVRWTCIAHGAAVTQRPEVASKLHVLHKVLSQRARSLDSLLLLKGKLDMLDAQLTYRKQLQAQRKHIADTNPNEPGMIIIEGEADQWSSEDEYDEAADYSVSKSKSKSKNGKKLPIDKAERDNASGDNEDEDDEENDRVLMNGVRDSEDDSEEHDSDEEEDDKDSDGILARHSKKRGGLVDIEAEVSGEESDLEVAAEDDDGDGDSSSGSSSGSESGEDDDEDEEGDSEMDSFINDGSISEVEDDGDINLDDDDDVDEEEDAKERSRGVKPPTKKFRHR